MFVQGSHMFAMFYVHTREKRGIPVLHVHITLTIFIRFAQNSTVGSILALYGSTIYACSYTYALFSGQIRL